MNGLTIDFWSSLLAYCKHIINRRDFNLFTYVCGQTTNGSNFTLSVGSKVHLDFSENYVSSQGMDIAIRNLFWSRTPTCQGEY